MDWRAQEGQVAEEREVMPDEKSPSSIIDTLGSRRFSLIILKAGVVLFLFLSLLWFANLIPPAAYMVWGPFSLWALLFIANLTVSLLTKKYAYKGNLISHIAFIFIFTGVLLSSLFRFSGEALVMEGDTFWGEEKEYLRKPSYGLIQQTPPPISFKLDSITPGYWDNQLYFVRLDAAIRYPGESPVNRGIIRLNGGFDINGSRVRLKEFGYFPEILVGKKGELIKKGVTRMTVFPPGAEDILEIDNYQMHVQVLPDPKLEGGRIRNMSMNLKEPVFLVRVVWLGRDIYRGALRKGEPVRFGDFSLTFTGIKPWVRIAVVKDPGEALVFSGFILGIAGLVMRLLKK